jgi:hypothetical protein
MKKEGGNSSGFLTDDEISTINHLIRVLGKHIEKFEAAYTRKDSQEFNSLKRGILQIQRKINSLVK